LKRSKETVKKEFTNFRNASATKRSRFKKELKDREETNR